MIIGEALTMADWVDIDGSQGEGGGQVLRTALALSVLTGRPFRMTQIRARRSNPGLAPQHLHAVRLFRGISEAVCRGDRERSRELQFAPGPVRASSYDVDIGTAGSVTLVLQAVSLPLALVGESSDLVLRGGTDVAWSPPFEYIASCWLPFMSRIGMELDVHLDRAGFYPKGGGQVRARIHGGARLRRLNLTERGALQTLSVVSATARLPTHVRERQARRVETSLSVAGISPTIRLVELEASSPGSTVAVTGVFEHTRVVATALGARGKSAETVGDEAASAFGFYVGGSGAVDEFLADQLILPLALAKGSSEYTTVKVTEHLLTSIQVIRAFLDRPITLEGGLGQPGRLRVD